MLNLGKSHGGIRTSKRYGPAVKHTSANTSNAKTVEKVNSSLPLRGVETTLTESTEKLSDDI